MQMDFNTFVNRYFNHAKKTADIVIANSVLSNGKINTHVDVELAKDLGVIDALEKVYYNYDPGKAITEKGEAKLTTFLDKVVHNCVLTELGKETTKAKRANLVARRGAISDAITPGAWGSGDNGKIMEPHEYMQYASRFKTKERIMKDMISKLKQLPEVDCKLVTLSIVDPEHYIDKAIKYFGWEGISRNAVQVRKRKALDKLKALMGGKRPDYRDVYISSNRTYASNSASTALAYCAEDGMLGYNDMRRRSSEISSTFNSTIDFKAVAESLYASLNG